MKAYKIGQTVEKSLYPIEVQLEKLKQSNKEYVNFIFSVFAPVFLSAILTIAVDDYLFIIDPKKNLSDYTWFEKIISTTSGKVAVYAFLFLLLSFLVYAIIRIIQVLEKSKDNKKTVADRNKLADNFYKIVIPEIITGAGLFEKAYEIEFSHNVSGEGVPDEETESVDAMDIFLDEVPSEKISDKALLYYYEALYHFRSVISEYEEIIEDPDNIRLERSETYKVIGKGALRNSLAICAHCVEEICKRTEDSNEDDTITTFKNYLRDVGGKLPAKPQ